MLHPHLRSWDMGDDRKSKVPNTNEFPLQSGWDQPRRRGEALGHLEGAWNRVTALLCLQKPTEGSVRISPEVLHHRVDPEPTGEIWYPRVCLTC